MRAGRIRTPDLLIRSQWRAVRSGPLSCEGAGAARGGGRSGYFADPVDNVWEVAWLPHASFRDAFRDGGALIWP